MVEDDEKRAIIDALESGQLVQGPRVEAFERAFADSIGTEHAIAVSNGTAALHVALLAHGVGAFAEGGRSDDEVIVPAFSFAATANTVLLAGARPVFVDVRDDDFCIDPALIEAAITPRTRAIMPVHLYGQICDIEPISRTTGAAISPAAESANPNRTEKNSTCRTSPSTNAPAAVEGMIPSRKSPKPTCRAEFTIVDRCGSMTFFKSAEFTCL